MRIRGRWRVHHGGLTDDYVGRLVIEDGVLMIQELDPDGNLVGGKGWPLREIAGFEMITEERS